MARERVESKISIQAMTFHNTEVLFIAGEREKREGQGKIEEESREGGREGIFSFSSHAPRARKRERVGKWRKVMA